MKKSKKVLFAAAALALAAAMTACGTSDNGASSRETSSDASSAAQSSADVSSAAPDDDSTQNPVMNFIGPYACDRAQMTVSCKGSQDAEIDVTWSGSASEYAHWTMSGTLNTDTLTVEYDNCRKEDVEVDSSGNTVKNDVKYENGKGRVKFADGTVVWEDDEEHIADGMTFTFNFDPESASASDTAE